MSTVHVIIRTIGEETYAECLQKVVGMGLCYSVVSYVKPLEMASKKTLKIAGEVADRYEWVMALDADVILTMTRKGIEDYCKEMEYRYRDKRLFSFTGYVNCTKRGVISGIHFFRTKYCREVFEHVKDRGFGFHRGREEYEICEVAKNELNFKVVNGYFRVPFGGHIFEAQLKTY